MPSSGVKDSEIRLVPSLPGQVIGVGPRCRVEVDELLAVKVERHPAGVGRKVLRLKREGHDRAGAAGKKPVADCARLFERRQSCGIKPKIGAPYPRPHGRIDIVQQVCHW